MIKYMPLPELKKFVHDVIYDSKNSGNLKYPDLAEAHMIGVGEKAKGFAEKIIEKYPWLKGKLNPLMMLVAGVVHDIGRPLDSNQNGHGLRSAYLIEKQGLKSSLSNCPLEIYRIAQTARSHGFTAEEYNWIRNNNPPNLECVDKLLLFPRTIPELLVAVADFCDDGKGGLTTPQKRIESIKERYSPGTELAKTAPAMVHAIQQGALERVLGYRDLVDQMCKGSLPEEHVARYGFL